MPLRHSFTILLFLLLFAPAASAEKFARWARIELTFQGPPSKGMGAPNPFAIPFDVEFLSPAGKRFLVPGFFDGDGKSGMNGSLWKVRFSTDQNGTWRYNTRSDQPLLNGKSGSFDVHDPPKDSPELFRSGRLEYTGERYLKFREGKHWIKFGADEPENFLGDAFGRNDWEAKKRQLRYLASTGVNSLYIMTHNLDGDSKDVWPWPGETAEQAKLSHDRFDIPKLARWTDFLEYAQSLGFVIQIVLEDDSAWIGYDHRRYMRELVARFGYLPAIYWNFCEEYNERYSLDAALGFMNELAKLDPYNHPRAIHNVRTPEPAYLSNHAVNVTSIQTNPLPPDALNDLAVDWMTAALIRGLRTPVVSFDEARPAEDRKSWWAVYTGGGIWESYIPVPNGYAALEPVWKELGRTRTFLESVPVEQMHPSNHIVNSGSAFCLAKPGEAYACYLPSGGSVQIALPAGNQYEASWFNPRASATRDWIPAGKMEGRTQTFNAPDSQDWALRILKISGQTRGPLTAFSAVIESVRGRTVDLYLKPLDLAPLAATVEIVDPPDHGTLSGAGAHRIYKPSAGFTGEDSIRWRLKSTEGVSNEGVIRILVRDAERNKPPYAQSSRLQTSPGRVISTILVYDDPGGPAPHQIRIVGQPRHGKLAGKENDVTYVPEPGFSGLDSFHWIVTDAAGARSNRATVEIHVQ